MACCASANERTQMSSLTANCMQPVLLVQPDCCSPDAAESKTTTTLAKDIGDAGFIVYQHKRTDAHLFSQFRPCRAIILEGVDAARTFSDKPEIQSHIIAVRRLSETEPEAPTFKVLGVGPSRKQLTEAIKNIPHPTKPAVEKFNKILGGSASLLKAFKRCDSVAKYSNSPIVLLGERGVGKELFADAIAQYSQSKALINAHITTTSELFLSELMGYRKGAFTGADQKTTGLFEKAKGGCLFLDELLDLPEAVQPALLRAIEYGMIRPLGQEEQQFDCRIIAATNKDPEKEIAAERFRRDLYDRMTFEVTIPPLRDRRDDIVPLAQHFLAFFGQKKRHLGEITYCQFDSAAIDKLLNYTWPGNVRQLMKVIQNAVVFCESPIISAEDIVLSSQPPSAQVNFDVRWEDYENAYWTYHLESSRNNTEISEITGLTSSGVSKRRNRARRN